MKFLVFKNRNEFYLGQYKEENNSIDRFDTPKGVAQNDGVTYLIGRELPPVIDKLSLNEVTLFAPIPRPKRNIFCVGKNYKAHAQEFSESGFDSSAAKSTMPEAPIVFSKLPETVIGQGMPIKMDSSVTTAIDYEAELAIIIGKEGRNISVNKSLSHVWGYTIVNDVTARDLQGRHSQWLIGKSQDTFCPIGPWVVTANNIDLSDTSVRCWVNNELRQDSNTSLMIFNVPTIIAAISNGITLKTGDIIATGTPAGVGIGFKPPKYLQSGDQIRIEIGGIGVLENSVVEI